MNKAYIIFFMVLTCSYSYAVVKPAEHTKQIKTTPVDAGYKVITTTRLITGGATKFYTKKSRATTQFALDISSKKEVAAKYIIKISPKRILICDAKNNVIKDLTVTKKWIDKSGPSTVYDLKDKNGVEYSLDHYIDSQNKHFLAFRFEKSLITYTDE